MKTTHLAGIITAAVLALTGCQTRPDDTTGRADAATGQTSTQDPTDSPDDTLTDEGTQEPEPVVSPALMERSKDKNGKYNVGSRDSLGGIVSWEVVPGPGLNKPLAERLGDKADAFLTEHVLREDRWIGSHQVKEGELDALAEKVTPQLYTKIERALIWLDKVNIKYDQDATKVPAKLDKRIAEASRIGGHFMLATDTIDGGTGRGRYELTRKAVYVPTNGDAKGHPTTWAIVKTRKENNTGKGREFAIWQGWKQVDGEWLIFTSGWSPR